MKLIRVTDYLDGTTHYLNSERIEQIQEVYGRRWNTAIAMMDAPPGDKWLRVRETVENIAAQVGEAEDD